MYLKKQTKKNACTRVYNPKEHCLLHGKDRKEGRKLVLARGTIGNRGPNRVISKKGEI